MRPDNQVLAERAERVLKMLAKGASRQEIMLATGMSPRNLDTIKAKFRRGEQIVYKRKCKFKHCGKPFKTVRRNQICCCDEHGRIMHSHSRGRGDPHYTHEDSIEHLDRLTYRQMAALAELPRDSVILKP